MWYINIKENGVVETIDEFETAKEARLMLTEYLMSDGRCYLSKQCTKDWRER